MALPGAGLAAFRRAVRVQSGGQGRLGDPQPLGPKQGGAEGLVWLWVLRRGAGGGPGRTERRQSWVQQLGMSCQGLFELAQQLLPAGSWRCMQLGAHAALCTWERLLLGPPREGTDEFSVRLVWMLGRRCCWIPTPRRSRGGRCLRSATPSSASSTRWAGARVLVPVCLGGVGSSEARVLEGRGRELRGRGMRQRSAVHAAREEGGGCWA